MYISTLLSASALVHLSIAGYALQDDYMQDFFGNFDFFTSADPTNGFVKFVDQSTAQSTGLINSTGSAVTWGVDSTNETPNGRPSVRISSKKTYDTGLVILDVAHMPVGCGTWPAFWMVGPEWPTNGEIDILEGVNEQETNSMTLHTGPNCAISTNNGIFSGEVATSNCDVNAADQNKNAGCSIASKDTQSYGTGLNSGQGGVYATQWTDQAISVYFFPRDSIPDDVTSGSPDPTGWGTPDAKFQGDCDIASTFKQQQIVFDTTFCGDWAGEVWSSGSCASKADTCESYVQNNPSAFANAYWTINSLKVYQDDGDATPAPGPSSIASVYPSSIASIIPTSEIPIPSLTVPVISGSTLAPPAVFTSAFSTVAPVPTVPVSTGFGGGRHSRSHRFSRSQDNNELAPTSAAPFPTGNSSSIASGPSAPAVTSGAATSNATLSSATTAPVASNRPGTNNNFPNGPMNEFDWPQAAGNGNNGGAASSAAASSKIASSAAASSATVPATTLGTATSAPAVPAVSSTQVAAAPTSNVPNRIVQTVYETLYVTVPASAPTPAARKARHVRQHRRRLTQHHAARR
ncbi:concanavalin A-like lectin/glucanase domain-containing protein [Lophiotrema nucula]|uniref:endo-1,3(4)-beta-glucanase n=1 Tax=Lophiotrema nucula TaxID=690887 RepID=A0A6A5ZG06_9PLEO|nr:concanavalin A-like lectin/glucanase domain-containing protein [Lophiotrema nucula]